MPPTSGSLHGIDTPAALVCTQRMQANIARMQAQVDALGARLRPHVKTTKCLPVVQAQCAGGPAASQCRR
jgi:D-serine deaminase-like pyridoxal phosphate-dependent protein